MFLIGLDQGSKTKVKNKPISGFIIIIISFPIEINVVDQRVWTSTIFDTKLNGTLKVMDVFICIFLLAFSRILHEAGHNNDKKGNIQSNMSKIDKASDQLLIQGCVDLRRCVVSQFHT